MRRLELSPGDVFNRWTLLEEIPSASGRRWLCRCACGTIAECDQGNLTTGATKSCGCLKLDMSHERAIVPEVGTRFGRLVIAGPVVGVGKSRTVLCVCDCGNSVTVKVPYLYNGDTRSCGCLKRDIARRNHWRHGHTPRGAQHPEYMAWSDMIRRCTNTNCKAYKDYGGRGISVCPRWMKSFDNFLNDVGLRPSDKHSLGRINNDGNYEPDNVRWETTGEQTRNKRNSVKLTINGVTKNLVDWSRELDLYPQVVGRRLKQGKTPYEALGLSLQQS